MIVGGSASSWTASAQAAASIADAAPIVWPSIDLIELIGTCGAASPNARFTAAVSMRSLTAVPVPWALM